jgi:hypothetical protein
VIELYVEEDAMTDFHIRKHSSRFWGPALLATLLIVGCASVAEYLHHENQADLAEDARVRERISFIEMPIVREPVADINNYDR